MREKGVEQVRQALPVLGREGDGVAEPEREGVVGARHAGPALGLVGEDDDGLAGAARHLGERPVGRQDAGAGVDHEEHHVGLLDRRFGLGAHAAEERARIGLLEAGGVDDAEAQQPEPRLTLAPVAGDAGAVVDERQAPADETVEERRFADIRPSDDGDRGRHRTHLSRHAGRASPPLPGARPAQRSGAEVRGRRRMRFGEMRPLTFARWARLVGQSAAEALSPHSGER